LRKRRIPPTWIEGVELPTFPGKRLRRKIYSVSECESKDHINEEDIQLFAEAIISPPEGKGLLGVTRRSLGHPFRLKSTVKTRINAEQGKLVVELEKIDSTGCLTSNIKQFVLAMQLANLPNLLKQNQYEADTSLPCESNGEYDDKFSLDIQ